jgi:hypothetical protein
MVLACNALRVWFTLQSCQPSLSTTCGAFRHDPPVCSEVSIDCPVCSSMLVGNHFRGTMVQYLFPGSAGHWVRDGHLWPSPQVKQWTVIKLDDFVPCKPDSRDPLGVARARDGMPEALYAHPHGKETWVACPNLHRKPTDWDIVWYWLILYDVLKL